MSLPTSPTSPSPSLTALYLWPFCFPTTRSSSPSPGLCKLFPNWNALPAYLTWLFPSHLSCLSSNHLRVNFISTEKVASSLKSLSQVTSSDYVCLNVFIFFTAVNTIFNYAICSLVYCLSLTWLWALIWQHPWVSNSQGLGHGCPTHERKCKQRHQPFKDADRSELNNKVPVSWELSRNSNYHEYSFIHCFFTILPGIQ